MAQEVVVPRMGYDMQKGTIVSWLKQEGDAVAEDEAIAEIETDKAVFELEAPASGSLLRIIAAEGATIPVARPSRTSESPARRFLKPRSHRLRNPKCRLGPSCRHCLHPQRGARLPGKWRLPLHVASPQSWRWTWRWCEERALKAGLSGTTFWRSTTPGLPATTACARARLSE